MFLTSQILSVVTGQYQYIMYPISQFMSFCICIIPYDTLETVFRLTYQ